MTYSGPERRVRDDPDVPQWEERRGRVTSYDQPPPIPNAEVVVWELVIADMRERDQVGRARYGTPLQPNNGRDALADAYAESLDLSVYLRQALYERDGR